MPILWRLMSISSALETLSRSSPSNSTAPAVGSTRRDRQRTTVDLPEPESPMMMNISPSRTSKLTSQAAAMCPVLRICSIWPDVSATAPPESVKKPSGSGP